MSDVDSSVDESSVNHDSAAEHPRPPRREFKARGSFVTRCDNCQLPVLNCLCPYQVKAESHAQVWLLTHPLEHYKPTNTGRLIGDVITTTQVFTWYRTAPDAQLAALLKDPLYAPFVILPVLPLRTERETRYRLRKPASKSHLCTAEVAIELLRQGGDTVAAGVLDDYFEVFNDSYAASRLHHKIDPPTAAMRRLAAKQSTGDSESGHPGAHRGA